ncbi:MAG: T9SS type A sorting domain-containing protein [Candidatus Coatesbacteria bacterium]|nr:MAG: T9SS type A sorting domain-containing protein [Candidatus Coatesbacteria bacterium]
MNRARTVTRIVVAAWGLLAGVAAAADDGGAAVPTSPGAAAEPAPSAPAAGGTTSGPAPGATGTLPPIFLPGEYWASQTNWYGGGGTKGPVSSFDRRYYTGNQITAGEEGSFWLASGGAKFEERVSLSFAGWAALLAATDVADVNGDKDPDVVTAEVTSGPTYWLRLWPNNGGSTPTFGPARAIFNGTTTAHAPLGIKVADVYGSASPDIVYLGKGMIVIAEQQSGGRWVPLVESVGGTFLSANGGDVDVGRVDGDDRADLIVAIAMKNSSRLYCYTRPGNRFVRNVIEGGREYFGVAAADFDGDGDDDVVATGRAGTTFFETTSSAPTWRKTQVFSSGGWETVVGDFNDDGWPDAAVVGEAVAGGIGVALYLNKKVKSPFKFDRHAVIPSGSSSSTVLLDILTADLNGDKRADLAVSRRDPWGLLVWYQDGGLPGSGDWEDIGGGVSLALIRPGDLDVDGFMDVVSADGGGRFNWYRFVGAVAPQGEVVSSILDTGGVNTAYKKANWTVDLRGGTAEVKARTSRDRDMAGAFAWGNCQPLEKGAAPRRENGVFDGDRYLQYRVVLKSLAGDSPRFAEIKFQLEAGDDDGPETSGVSVWPNPVAGAREVLIQAQVSDVNYGNSVVTAAEYFVDQTPGAGGSGTPLEPTDGKWDSPLEAVRLAVSPAGWGEAETHALYVRGRDARGNWGEPKTFTFEMGEVSFFPEESCFPYPNPATGEELQIRYFVTKEADVKLEVFDLRGRLLAEARGRTDGYAHDSVTVDISDFAPDIYFYRATATAVATGEREVVGKKFAVLK